jgi:V-ATPase subunit C
MRSIDLDIKSLNDNMNETRNNLNQYTKKEGSSLMSKDISEAIYSDPNLRAEDNFVECHGTSFLSTLVIIVHK